MEKELTELEKSKIRWLDFFDPLWRFRIPELHYGSESDILKMLSNISPEDMEKMNSVFQMGDIVQSFQKKPK